ncbi:hypothetical protein C8R47DRAFT_768040 [Mycena vitilis]|nr:hypothetical protein C8R47DRAFT_768040 [Mycena vitilis]
MMCTRAGAAPTGVSGGGCRGVAKAVACTMRSRCQRNSMDTNEARWAAAPNGKQAQAAEAPKENKDNSPHSSGDCGPRQKADHGTQRPSPRRRPNIGCIWVERSSKAGARVRAKERPRWPARRKGVPREEDVKGYESTQRIPAHCASSLSKYEGSALCDGASSP